MADRSFRPGLALVTGAAGGMGARLVSRLLSSGWKVRALTLPGDPLAARLAGPGCDVREADVRDAASLGGLFDGVDIVYHLAAVIISHDPTVFARVNREGTAHVLSAAVAAAARHLVYVSSASVTYPRRTPYGESKLEAEKLVMGQETVPWTIIRPTLAYDESVGLELSMFRRYLERFWVVPFIGDGRAMKRPVWSEDIVDGLVRLASSRISHGKIYNFSGGESISMIDFARLVLEHAGSRKRFVKVPVPLCRAAALFLRVMMKEPPLTMSGIAGVIHDADLDPGEAMRDLGYCPIGVRDGFRRCFPIAAHSRSESVLQSLSEGNST